MRIISTAALKKYYTDHADFPLVDYVGNQRYVLNINDMCNFNKEQYEYALSRIEYLIDRVPDCEPTTTPEAMELSIMSEIVMEYEDEHFSMADDMQEYAVA